MPKLLFIRFSSIGDIVLTTPAIRTAKDQIPNVEIHFLTKQTFIPILKSNPYVDRIFGFKTSLQEVLSNLKKERYDAIIDLHHNLRSFHVKRALGVPSFSFNKLNIEKWLLVNLRINRLPDIHITARYLDTLGHFGVMDDGRGLDYYIPQKSEVDLQTLPAAYQKGYIGFVIGGSYNTKMLPEDKIVSVCRAINYPVVLLGGPEDADKGEDIALRSGHHVLNACGKYSLHQSASLVSNALRIITHDTGLMHIAAAFKKPVLSVWGNTIPAFGMYPFRPGEGSKILEIETLRCRPCSKLGYDKCPKKHFYCMQLHDTDEIARWANGEDQ